MRLRSNQLATFLLILTLGTGAIPTPAGPGLSVTGVSSEFHRVAAQTSVIEQPLAAQILPLDDFISQVVNGNAYQIVGVYSPQLFSLEVRQQPANNPGYVSSEPGIATQFSMASTYGSTGLLAHNTVSGEVFYDLIEGQLLLLVYGDGSLEYYRVAGLNSFQALSPSSPYSDFIALDSGGARLDASQLFTQIYSVQNRLVLQTCIANDGNPNWGRFFVTATPFSPFVKADHPPMAFK
jgi:hypothetical protein